MLQFVAKTKLNVRPENSQSDYGQQILTFQFRCPNYSMQALIASRLRFTVGVADWLVAMP